MLNNYWVQKLKKGEKLVGRCQTFHFSQGGGGGRLFKICSTTEPFKIIEISPDLSNIPPESSDDDHGDYTGEEEDHDYAVDDGEPVDLSICHL